MTQKICGVCQAAFKLSTIPTQDEGRLVRCRGSPLDGQSSCPYDAYAHATCFPQEFHESGSPWVCAVCSGSAPLRTRGTDRTEHDSGAVGTSSADGSIQGDEYASAPDEEAENRENEEAAAATSQTALKRAGQSFNYSTRRLPDFFGPPNRRQIRSPLPASEQRQQSSAADGENTGQNRQQQQRSRDAASSRANNPPVTLFSSNQAPRAVPTPPPPPQLPQGRFTADDIGGMSQFLRDELREIRQAQTQDHRRLQALREHVDVQVTSMHRENRETRTTLRDLRERGPPPPPNGPPPPPPAAVRTPPPDDAERRRGHQHDQGDPGDREFFGGGHRVDPWDVDAQWRRQNRRQPADAEAAADQQYQSRLSKAMSGSTFLSKYDGKDKTEKTFRRWKRDVEMHLTTAQIRREHWGILLLHVTTGPAKQLLERHLDQTDENYPVYDDAMQQMQSAFVHKELPSSFLPRLVQLEWRKNSGQSLTEFVAEIREVAALAFPHNPEEAEEQVKAQFIKGLPHWLVPQAMALEHRIFFQ